MSVLSMQDRVAVITGGGAGLGESIAHLLAERGARIVIGDIDPRAGESVASSIRDAGGLAISREGDVSIASDCQALVEAATTTWGHLDMLVCNAGVQVDQDVLGTSEEQWDRVIDVNLKGAFLCCKYAVSHMRKQASGSILMISSLSGLVGNEQQVSYNASKHGLIGLMRAMAADHAKDNIRVNCLCPGSMNTAMLRKIPAEKLAPYQDRNLQRRFADPEEVARCAVFLLSDEASYVTGSVMTVDGGYTTI